MYGKYTNIHGWCWDLLKGQKVAHFENKSGVLFVLFGGCQQTKWRLFVHIDSIFTNSSCLYRFLIPKCTCPWFSDVVNLCVFRRKGRVPYFPKTTKKTGEGGIASKSMSSKTTKKYPEIDLQIYLGQGNGLVAHQIMRKAQRSGFWMACGDFARVHCMFFRALFVVVTRLVNNIRSDISQEISD